MQASVTQVEYLLKRIKRSHSILIPTNIEEERHRFFTSSTYNPHFVYTSFDAYVYSQTLLEELKQIELVSDVPKVISDCYLTYIDELHITNQILHSVGDNDVFTKLSVIKYHSADVQTETYIQSFLNNYTKEKPQKRKEYLYTCEEIQHILEEVIDELRLHRWKVRILQTINPNAITTTDRYITIHPEIKRTAIQLKKSIVHEIGTHVLRTLNGRKNRYKLFRKPNTVDYLDTEEGLALYNEELFNTLSQHELVKRVLLAWSTMYGIDMTFRALWEKLKMYVSDELAFQLTLRVKRGLGDTGKSGIFSKDIVYLRGFLKVKQALLDDPALYTKLYAGKISLAQTSLVDASILHLPFAPLRKELLERIFDKYITQ